MDVRASPSRALWLLAILGACSSADIELRPSQRFQEMRGWEGLVGGMPECNPVAWGAIRERVIDLAANELGMNRVRIPLRAGYEDSTDHFTPFLRGETTFDDWKRTWFRPVNDDDDPRNARPGGFQWAHLDNTMATVVLPLRERLRARGDDLWINLIYVGASSSGHQRDPAEYAELVDAAFRHLRDTYGLVPNSFEVVNEPNMRSAWTPHEVAAALLAVRERLAASGFSPEFIAPSTSTLQHALLFLDSMQQIPGVKEALTDVSYHRYSGGREALERLVRRTRALGLRTAMLEKINADHHVLHEDLTIGGVSAWGQFGMVFCPPRDSVNLGGIYVRVDETDPHRPTAYLTPYARLLRQYFRHVSLGAVRLGTRVRGRGIEATAFVNPDGRHVVVANVDEGRMLSVAGLPPARYRVTYTTSDSEDTDPVSATDTTIAAGGVLRTRIPARGVLTVFVP